jgi:hypothetical protein
MPEIPLKYVKHTGEREFLRVYWETTLKPEEHSGWSYHNAMIPLRDILDPHIFEKDNGISIHTVNDDEYKQYEGKWPTKCEYCDATVPPRGTPDTEYMIFYESLYDDPPRLIQPGDVWDVPWMHDSSDSWAVKLPSPEKHDIWYTYMIASNCNHGDLVLKNEKGEIIGRTVHRCWTTTGTPPNLDVNPSILINQGRPHEWHGFIRNGKLVW